MPIELKNCWEIERCGREVGGALVRELGLCPVARDGMGHSCWSVAGTLCGEQVQGTIALKEKNCMACEVYKLYNRTLGTRGRVVIQELPREEARYRAILIGQLRKV